MEEPPKISFKVLYLRVPVLTLCDNPSSSILAKHIRQSWYVVRFLCLLSLRCIELLYAPLSVLVHFGIRKFSISLSPSLERSNQDRSDHNQRKKERYSIAVALFGKSDKSHPVSIHHHLRASSFLLSLHHRGVHNSLIFGQNTFCSCCSLSNFQLSFPSICLLARVCLFTHTELVQEPPYPRFHISIHRILLVSFSPQLFHPSTITFLSFDSTSVIFSIASSTLSHHCLADIVH